jgi:putative ABC transport system ATP-binding protein
MLNVKDLTKTFKSGDSTVVAVDKLKLDVAEGTFAAIVGKSGSGKSTLLGLLGALDRPTSGTIKVDGKDVTKMNDQKLIKYRRNTIGYVFQNYSLIPNLTALENVMLPMEFAGLSVAKRKQRAQELLNQVGIEDDQQGRKPARLSGGQQQRVAIARALANEPKLILADEPTGNLDSKTGKVIFDLLHELTRKQKTTIIVVTHDLGIAGKTDMVFRLTDGRLKQ